MTAIPGSEEIQRDRRGGARAAIRSVAPVLAIALGLLSIGAGYGIHTFGSIPASLAYLRGERLLVDEPAKSINGAEAGSNVIVRYTLSNLSGGPIRLIGMTSSCTCIMVDDLP